MADVVVAVAVLRAQAAGQRRENAERGERKQPAVGDLVDAMAEGVVSAQRQAGELLGHAGLQPGVVAARAGAEFVHAAEALVERLIVGKGREASSAHRLIAVQLHLVRLMHGARADVIDAQRAARPKLALDAEAPLQKVGRLQRAAGEGVEVDRERSGRRWTRKADLEGLVGLRGRVDGAIWNSGRDADAANLSVDPADKDRRIGRVRRAQVGDLRRNDVVEDAAARVDRRLIRQLVGHRSARLPTEERRRRGRDCARWSGWPGSRAA